MLNQKSVDEHEERLRGRIRQLPEADRERFYSRVKGELRDPDTYAALNWFFVAGLHHFYLGKWARGSVNLAVFSAGVALLALGYSVAGVGVILLVSLFEIWALFRSQIIVQDWNNRVYERALGEYERGDG